MTKKKAKAKVTTPTSRFREITPKIAADYIERSEAAGIINRKISDAKVRQWTYEMLNDWCPEASTIIVDENDLLCEGWHRMYACVMADVSFVTNFIVTTDRRRCITKTDVGRPKSAGDVLAMDSQKYANTLASATRMRIKHLATGYAWDTSVVVTNTMIENYVHEHQASIDKMIMDLPKDANRITSVTKMLFLMMAAKTQSRAADFCFQIANGYNRNETGLAKRDPSFVLRNRLIAARLAKQTNKHADKLDTRQETYLVCIAYRHWIKGDKLQRLQLPKAYIGDEKRAATEAYKLPKNL